MAPLRANAEKCRAKRDHGLNLTNLFFEFKGDRIYEFSKVLGFMFLHTASFKNI